AIGSDKVLDPPGWVFILYPTWVAHVNVLTKWIQDTWDYKKMGRNPRLATLGWDNTMGTCHIKPSQKYVKDHNIEVDLGPFEVTPMRTMDFSANIMRIKEAGVDYLYLPMVPGPTAVAIKQIKASSVPFKVCVNDAGGAIPVLKKVVGLANVQGIIRLAMYEWYSSNSPGMTLVKKLQAKYHPKEFVAMSSYFWCYQSSMVMTEAIGKIIKEKGFDKLNSEQLFKQFKKIEIDTQGINGSVLKLGERRRVASSVIRFDKFEGETWVGMSKWYPTD
ncbi:MAG: ABC transporter substrate-binding protein, partial [Thermodesulfobacteriota bacterium]|nr:ABC transporter substrate-binding protein [Thermodesulfobacteriota bacterium]